MLCLLVGAGCQPNQPAASRGSTPTSSPPSDRPPTEPALAPPVALPVPADAQRAMVVRHVDGDTVVLRGEGVGPLTEAPTKVRFLLVDTPEVFGTVECFGRQASARTAALLPVGASVRVQRDVDLLDRYGRTLLLLWTDDGTSVQETLLREGDATVLQVGRNHLDLAALRAAEADARAAGRGLWTACPRH